MRQRGVPGLKKDKPLSNIACLAVLRVDRDDITTHGFRSTFRDRASEATNFPREVAEMALENKVEAAYRRGIQFEKRSKLVSAWAGYCDTTCSANIVQLKHTGSVHWDANCWCNCWQDRIFPFETGSLIA